MPYPQPAPLDRLSAKRNLPRRHQRVKSTDSVPRHGACSNEVDDTTHGSLTCSRSSRVFQLEQDLARRESPDNHTPGTMWSHFLPHDSPQLGKSHPSWSVAGPMQSPPFQLVPPRANTFASPTRRATIEKTSEKHLHRMMAGLPSTVTANLDYDEEEDQATEDELSLYARNAFERRRRPPTITKVVYVERPVAQPIPQMPQQHQQHPPRSPSKKKFFGFNITVPSFRPTGDTGQQHQACASSTPRSPEDFTGPAKAAEILGPAEQSAKRSKSKIRTRLTTLRPDHVNTLPPTKALEPGPLGIAAARYPKQIDLARQSPARRWTPISFRTPSAASTSAQDTSVPLSNFFGLNIRDPNNGIRKQPPRQALRTVSDSKAAQSSSAGNEDVLNVQHLARSQSLRYLDDDSPPTPPAKNTPPKILVGAHDVVKLEIEGDDNLSVADRALGACDRLSVCSSRLEPSSYVRVKRVPSNYSIHGDIQGPFRGRIMRNSKNQKDGEERDEGISSTSNDFLTASQHQQLQTNHNSMTYTPSVYSQLSAINDDAATHLNHHFRFPPSASQKADHSSKRNIRHRTSNSLHNYARSCSSSPSKVRFSEVTSPPTDLEDETNEGEIPIQRRNDFLQKNCIKLTNSRFSPLRNTAHDTLKSTLKSFASDISIDRSPAEKQEHHMSSWEPYHPSACPTPLTVQSKADVNVGDNNLLLNKKEQEISPIGCPPYLTPSQFRMEEAQEFVKNYRNEIVRPCISMQSPRSRSEDKESTTKGNEFASGPLINKNSLTTSPSLSFLLEQHNSSLSLLNTRIQKINRLLAFISSQRLSDSDSGSSPKSLYLDSLVSSLASQVAGLITQVRYNIVPRFEELAEWHETTSLENRNLNSEVIRLKDRLKPSESTAAPITTSQMKNENSPPFASISNSIRSALSVSNGPRPSPLFYSQLMSKSREERVAFCEGKGRSLKARIDDGENYFGLHPSERRSGE